MSRFVPVDRDTAYLLPPSVDEWLPKDHLARFVVEVIDRLDLGEVFDQPTDVPSQRESVRRNHGLVQAPLALGDERADSHAQRFRDFLQQVRGR